MQNLESINGMLSWLIPVLIILAIWDGVWKLIALWKAARNNELTWFICLALLNTAGILPIVYILICRNKARQQAATA